MFSGRQTRSCLSGRAGKTRAAARALQWADRLLDPNHTPLAVKKEFFDPQIVDLIRSAATRGATLKQFQAGVKWQAEQQLLERESLTLASRPVVVADAVKGSE